MVLIAVAAFGVRISTDETHGFGASSPSYTRASPMDFSAAGGSVESPLKLVRRIGSRSSRAKELLSPCFARSAVAYSVPL